MEISQCGLDGLVLIRLNIYSDERGFFTERYHRERFREAGLPFSFLQDNHSRSGPGVLRGLHYQQSPAQGKLVGVIRGRIWDVAVDLRADSPTFGRHFGIELGDSNGLMLWIPPGFAHGFCVPGDEPADVIYKVDAGYNPKGEGGIFWADPELGIEWPVTAPVVSARDQKLMSFAEYRLSPANWNQHTGGNQ
ncbi:MAG TPA: dTDP-4-dehydrorhamnose 3,5-epimerase [Blastocatellia bacterium]|nr:dTDP-4-dehydrorhamnose 3,5-epimerase [Blastocatellia bacterium]